MPWVVLVEPDATVRDAITEVLNNGGLSVIALASGWDTFRLFDRIESPALLVSDINLGPTLDGFKLAIAAQCRWAGLPVICVASHPVRYTTLTCGPFDWCRMTPFTPDGTCCETMLQFTTPGQIGALAVMLCDDAAATVTGVAWPVDGGRTAQ